MRPMEKILVNSIIAIIMILTAFLLSMWYWGLWFYDGWPAPPNIAAPLLDLDGENASDAKIIEFFAIILFLEIIIFAAVRKMRRRQVEGSRTGSGKVGTRESEQGGQSE